MHEHTHARTHAHTHAHTHTHTHVNVNWMIHFVSFLPSFLPSFLSFFSFLLPFKSFLMVSWGNKQQKRSMKKKKKKKRNSRKIHIKKCTTFLQNKLLLFSFLSEQIPADRCTWIIYVLVLLQNESIGETGYVSFNSLGERDNFSLFVTALSGDHQIMTVRDSADQASW